MMKPNFYKCIYCDKLYDTKWERNQCERICLVDMFTTYSSFSPQQQDEEIVIEVSL